MEKTAFEITEQHASSEKEQVQKKEALAIS